MPARSTVRRALTLAVCLCGLTLCPTAPRGEPPDRREPAAACAALPDDCRVCAVTRVCLPNGRGERLLLRYRWRNPDGRVCDTALFVER